MASQVLTEYPIPSSGPVAPAKITLATDGALWFTENAVSPATLGRITTSGNLTQIPDQNVNASGNVTFGITRGPDENLYTTEQGTTPVIAQVIPTVPNLTTTPPTPIFTQYSNFSLPGTHNPNSITSGPKGDKTYVWFTDSGGSVNAIGRLNVNGAPNQPIQEFPVTSSMVIGTEIAPGPAGDNGLYFTESLFGTTQTFIGKIDDATGNITNFPVTNPNGIAPGIPTQLAAGPGDSIYFTEENTGRIGRLDLATGVVNDNFFTIPPVTLPNNISPTPVGPTAIAQFPDGTLYITESNIGAIARLAVGSNGAVTGFFQYTPFPSVNGALPGISPDFAGNVWFTQTDTDQITNLAIASSPLVAQSVAINGTINQPLTNIPVATFTDLNGPSPNTQYRASINWGDGTALDTNTTLSPTGTSNAFQVLASHTYTTAGRFTATVTITDLASPRTATVFDTASVSVSPVGPSSTIQATAGTPFLGTTSVATFPVPSGTTGSYSATIDWGDGTALGGATITSSTVGGVTTDSVIGTHTFAQPGTFNGSVTVRNPDGSLTVFPLVSNVNSFTAAALPPGASPQGTAGTTLPATFTLLANLRPNPGSPVPNPAFYSATINWGDGTSATTGLVQGTSTGLDIIPPTHTYATPGNYSISYTLADAGAPNLFSGNVTAIISALTPNGSGTLGETGTAGTPISASTTPLVALAPTAGSPNPNPVNYSATINWGDGTPATVAQVIGSGAALEIFPGSHIYAAQGIYPITYALSDAGTPVLATGTYNATIGSITGTPIGASGIVGQPVGGSSTSIPLETLSSLPPLQSGYYSATIDYGDGSPTSVGTLVGNTIVGPSHTYLSPGNFHVGILLGTTGQPNLAQFSSTISVTEAPITIDGTLNPTSDSGISNTDGITNDVTPNFFGTTAPGATVRIFAVPAASASTTTPILIGQRVADATGAYSINTIPLADNAYVVEIIATSKFGTQTASTFPESGSHPLIIDTVGPRIIDFGVTNTLKGQFQVIFQDSLSGLVFSQLVNGSNYDVQRPLPKPQSGQNFTISSLSATPLLFPTERVTVTGSVFNGHYLVLRGGEFIFTINASGITDVAGNALDGEYYGTFPTGDNHPGGNFKAEVIIRQYTPSGPIPFTTANPSHPGVAAIAPSALGPKLKRLGLNAPPTALPGVNTGQPLSSTSTPQNVVTKSAKAKALVAKAKEVVAKVVVKAKSVIAKQHKA